MRTAATKKVFVAAGGHPFGACQVAFPGGTSAFGLSFGIHAQYDARYLFPVGADGIGVEEPQIRFKMTVVVGGEYIAGRRSIGDRRIMLCHVGSPRQVKEVEKGK
jgi:hypothetical protein